MKFNLRRPPNLEQEQQGGDQASPAGSAPETNPGGEQMMGDEGVR